MQLAHIELGKLSVSAANMRNGKKPPDISDILPTVRARGVIVPLIVRPNGGPDSFEIVAGRRRFFAAVAVAEESGLSEPLPCAIMEAGDDAAALEASLIENVARMDAHEVDQWETFTRLVTKEGRKPDEIAATFGLTETMVKRVLALGNLLPGIRALYRKEEIDAATVRFLTMATKSQQKEWLAMLADPMRYTPTGHQLKSWLFGGATISTSVALFDLAAFPGAIVADLFGEGGYFADAGQFWAAQREAVEAKRAAYLEAGWAEVVTLEPGSHFNSWEYEKTPKKKGGRVYIALSARGEATFHEGYVSRREARRRDTDESEGAAKTVRPEVTGTMQTYIDLHRHAAVRAELVGQPRVALRLMAAHVIQGSYLFSVKPDPQRGGSNAVTESVETCAAEAAFDLKRREVLAVLGFDPDTPTVIGGGHDPFGTAGLFVRLLALSDEEVLAVIAIVMGEALEAGSAVVEALGLHLGVDMADHFAPDDAFFELIRDKEVLTAMVAELAGDAVAKANAKEKAKTQKAVIRDCLAGENGRKKVERFVPRWLAFPPSAYTERGGVNSVRRANEIAELFAPEEEPGPDAPAAAADLPATASDAADSPPWDEDPAPGEIAEPVEGDEASATEPATSAEPERQAA